MKWSNRIKLNIIDKLLIERFYKILSKNGGFFYVNENDVITVASKDFYEWIYSTGYYSWLREKTKKEIKEPVL